MGIKIILTLMVLIGLIGVNRMIIGSYQNEQEKRKESNAFKSVDTPELFAVCCILPLYFLASIIWLYIVWM